MKYLVFTLLVLFVACAPKPTKVTSESPVLSRKEMQKNKLTEGTVVLDVRPPFEFNVSHIPGAINVAWEDFSRRAPDARGLLERDLHPITRRLALIGIEPTTTVLVVGKGKLGKGEDGRVAWTLESLGVQNVQLAPSDAFREKKGEDPQIPNRKFWDATLDKSLEISWNELRTKIEGSTGPSSKARSKALGGAPLPVKMENFVVVDVRSREEYSIDNLNKRTPKTFRFENIDWKNFFTDEMDPNPAVMKTLNEAGITQMTEINLISNHGVRSGAVTWALQKLGYKKARNFAGGYEQVVFKRK
jgi:thiosulfate/3-mercaptopyruvate sulfurtransferase